MCGKDAKKRRRNTSQREEKELWGSEAEKIEKSDQLTLDGRHKIGNPLYLVMFF